MRDKDDRQATRLGVSEHQRSDLAAHGFVSDGGGGHAFAAGFTATGVLSEIRDRLLVRLKDSGL